MNALYLNSNLSLASTFQQRSLISDPTTHSSDETVRGIGTLGGKAILAVGEATLRGFESLLIKRKLRAINNTFPHKDRDIIKGIEKLYDDALELSRPPLYREPVRQQVLKLLLTQIATRQTSHLLKSLFKWPCIELAIFLRSIMGCMPPDWLPPKMIREKTQRELMLAYLTSQPASHQEYHPASPLLDFLMTIATANDSSCQAVLDAGFLNMLLCMYTCNFGFSMTPHLSANGDQCKLMMLEACSDAILSLCEFPGAVTVISLHPICNLWPKNRPLSIRFPGREGERATAWRSLGEVREDMVSRRLASLPSALQCPVPDDGVPTPLLMDLYRDLLEFSRSEMYGLRIANDASRWVRKFAELGGAHWMALNDALDELPLADSTALRSRLIPALYPDLSPLRSGRIPTSIPAAEGVRIYPRNDSQHSHRHSRATSESHLVDSHPGNDLVLHRNSWDSSISTPLAYQPETIYADLTPDSDTEHIWEVQCPIQPQRVYRMARWEYGLRLETYDYAAPDPCLPGTRDSVLSELRTWIEGSTGVLWLQGMLGEGKTAIASSVARWFTDPMGTIMGMCVFFSRNDPWLGDAACLIPTIAVQLSRCSSSFNQHLCKAMDNYDQLLDQWGRSFDEFELFLKAPLEAAARSSSVPSTFIIVLDGLDELWCDTSSRASICSTLRKLVSLPKFVKFVIASTPQAEVGSIFESSGTPVQILSLSDIPRDIVDLDINAFVSARMLAFTYVHEQLQDDDLWPGKGRIASLIDKAEGNFLWASRAIAYIETESSNPEHNVKYLLGALHGASDNVLGMDEIYINALESAYLKESFLGTLLLCHEVMGVLVSVKRPISLDTLHVLVKSGGLPHLSNNIDILLSRLSSAIHVSGAGSIRMAHSSFARFLSSSRCPNSFAIETPINHHFLLAKGCLINMENQLIRNMCGIVDTMKPNEVVQGLESKIKQYIPDDLQYACQFWADHLSLSSLQYERNLFPLLQFFLYDNLRNWLEVLSLMGLVTVAIPSLVTALEWLDDTPHTAVLRNRIEDVCNSIADSSSRLTASAGYSHDFPLIISSRTPPSPPKIRRTATSMPTLHTTTAFKMSILSPHHRSLPAEIQPLRDMRSHHRAVSQHPSRQSSLESSSTELTSSEWSLLPLSDRSSIDASSRIDDALDPETVLDIVNDDSEAVWDITDEKEAARHAALRVLCSLPWEPTPATGARRGRTQEDTHQVANKTLVASRQAALRVLRSRLRKPTLAVGARGENYNQENTRQVSAKNDIWITVEQTTTVE